VNFAILRIRVSADVHVCVDLERSVAGPRGCGCCDTSTAMISLGGGHFFSGGL
jgi:hypothetical protein